MLVKPDYTANSRLQKLLFSGSSPLLEIQGRVAHIFQITKIVLEDVLPGTVLLLQITVTNHTGIHLDFDDIHCSFVHV